MTSRTAHLLKALVSLLLLGVCVAYADFGRLPAAMGSVEFWALSAAFVLNVGGSVIVPALLTRTALDPARLSLSISRLILLNFIMRFYILVLPRAVSTGMRWYRYKQHGTGADAFALMAFVAVVQFLVYAASATFLIAHERSLLGASGVWLLVLALGSAVAGVLAILLFLFPAFGRSMRGLAARSPLSPPEFVRARLDRWWTAVVAYNGLSLRALIKIVALSLGSYALFVGSAYAVAVSMGLGLSLAAIAWVRSVVFLLTLIPITVGGVGVREVGTVALFGLYGVAQHEALAFALVMLGVQLLIGLVGISVEAGTFLRGVCGYQTGLPGVGDLKNRD